MNAVAILPVKNLSNAKSRLSNVLDLELRKEFVTSMLRDVTKALVHASSIDKVVIVTPDKSISNVISLSSKISIIYDEGLGQIPAVVKALNLVSRYMKPRIVLLTVVDVPLIKSKDINDIIKLAQYKTVVMVPSINGGTNVIAQHPPGLVELKYGKDSFRKHLLQAALKDINVEIYVSPHIVFDVDDANDLKLLLDICLRNNDVNDTETCMFMEKMIRVNGFKINSK